MNRVIKTENAPAPIGPYSQAVFAGNFLYVSGQVAIIPQTGEMVQSSIADETQQVLKNIKEILHAAELNFDNVIKATIFLSDMDLFPEVNQVYGSFFQNDFPARETVAVKGLPKNANVEISVIAYKA